MGVTQAERLKEDGNAWMAAQTHQILVQNSEVMELIMANMSEMMGITSMVMDVMKTVQ